MAKTLLQVPDEVTKDDLVKIISTHYFSSYKLRRAITGKQMLSHLHQAQCAANNAHQATMNSANQIKGHAETVTTTTTSTVTNATNTVKSAVGQ